MRINDLNKITGHNRIVAAHNPAIKPEAPTSPNLKKILGKRTQNKKRNILQNLPRSFPKFSNMVGSFKHSGDIGDLIYSLPVIRYLGYSDLYLNPRGLATKKIDGSASGFNLDLIKILTPLLESQHYIRKVDCWNNESVIVDMDYFRKVNPPVPNLCEKILYSFSIPFYETQKPWIQVESKRIAPLVFARSFRYRNNHMDYKQFINNKDDCVFVGLHNEYVDFCERFGKIPYYAVKNFYELAQVISGCDTFHGNQSSPMSIAIAMHKNFIQESFKNSPDCMFDFKNARYVL